MERPFAASAAPRPFALDRERFARFCREELDELEGIDSACAGGIAKALEYRFHDAREAGSITGPPGVEAIVYALEDSLIVAVRELDLPRDLPVALRQLATYSFEIKHVLDHRDGSFEEVCAAIEELLEKANALLPSFDALRRAERALAAATRHAVEVTTEGLQIRDTQTGALRADVWSSRKAAETACEELNDVAAAPPVAA